MSTDEPAHQFPSSVLDEPSLAQYLPFEPSPLIIIPKKSCEARPIVGLSVNPNQPKLSPPCENEFGSISNLIVKSTPERS